ncbi:MAG TPA: MFS transporter [Novosphingobium sp.]|nr:MFS transporter [Novosphingobium sp.]
MLLGIVCVVDAMIISSLLTPIKADLGLNDEAFGRIAAAFTLAGVLGAPLFGYAAGRLGRKPVLIAGAVLWSIASAFNALAAGVAGLLFWRAVTGFGEAAYQGLAPGWLADLYDKRWRNLVFSVFMVRNKIGSALALALGAWLAGAYNWHIAFLVSGLPGLVCAAWLALLPEPRPGAADGYAEAPRHLTWREQLSVLRHGRYAAHLAALALFFSGTATAQMWAPAYLHRVYALSNAAASGFLATVLLATLPVGLVGGYVFGRWLSPYRWGLTAALAATSLLAAGFFAQAFLTRDLATAKLFIILAICAFGSTAGSLTTLLVELVPPHLRTAAGALGAVVVAAISGALAPWLLGYLSDRIGLDRAILVGPAAYALAGLIWIASLVALRFSPLSPTKD